MKTAVYFLLVLVPCLCGITTTVAQTRSIQDLTKLVLQILITQKLHDISEISPIAGAMSVRPSHFAANQVASPGFMANQGSATNHISPVPVASPRSATIGFGPSPSHSNQRSTGAFGNLQPQQSTFTHSTVGPRTTFNRRRIHTINGSPVINRQRTSAIRSSNQMFKRPGFQQPNTKPRGPSVRPSTSFVNEINAFGKAVSPNGPVRTKTSRVPTSHFHPTTPSSTVQMHPAISSNMVSKQGTLQSAKTASNAVDPVQKSTTAGIHSNIEPLQGSPKQATSPNTQAQVTTSDNLRPPQKPKSSNFIISSAKRINLGPSPGAQASNSSFTTVTAPPATSISPTQTMATSLRSSTSPSVSMADPSTQQTIQTTTQASTTGTKTVTMTTPEQTSITMSSTPTSTAPPIDSATANLTLSIQRFTESGNNLTTLLEQQANMYNTGAEALQAKASDVQAKAENLPFGSPQRNELMKQVEQLSSQQNSKLEVASLLTELRMEIFEVFVEVDATTKEVAALQSP